MLSRVSEVEFWRNCLPPPHTDTATPPPHRLLPPTADVYAVPAVCRVADFSHVAAILHASGVISEQQATQPHAQRAPTQTASAQLYDSTAHAQSSESSTAAADLNGGRKSATPSLLVSPAGAGIVHSPPPLLSAGASLPDVSAYPVVRCGVIGSGRGASRLIALLEATRGCRVVSVLSKNEQRSAALRKAHPSIDAVQSEQSAFLSQPDLDAVFIASSVGSVQYGSHHALALACAERRRPTVVERPLARSASEAREMQSAFERSNTPLLVHQPVRAMPAIRTLQQAIVALQRVTSVSYSFSAPLAALSADIAPSATLSASVASSTSTSSSASCLPCLPRRLVSSGGPLLPLVCDLFDVLECALGAVSHVTGDACSGASETECESVLSCSFRCGGALGCAVWDLASTSTDDRLVLRGTGGDLTLSLYQPSMPILQTAEGIQQISAAPHSNDASAASDSAGSDALQRIVEQLRRHALTSSSSERGAGGDGGKLRSEATGANGAAIGRAGSDGVALVGGADGGPIDVCLVSAAMAVRSLACADAALRSFHRLRTDAYWNRPLTWHSHAWSVPTRPK